MAKKAYIGVDSVAHQVKKWYVGIDGVARKVKKGYIGVNGTARQFFGGGELRYHKAINLSTARRGCGAASVGNYGIFTGGRNTNDYILNTSEAVDNNLTVVSATNLYTYAYSQKGVTVGNYALFGGGSGGNSTVGYDTYLRYVDTYNASLTHGTAPDMSVSRGWHATANAGNYALFAGGTNEDDYSGVGIKNVDAYNASLTRSTPTQLSTGRSELSGASLNGHAIFAGGSVGSNVFTAVVESYDSSLTRTTRTSMSTAKAEAGGARVGDYVLFAGGRIGSMSKSTTNVEAYNTSFTRSTITPLGTAMFQFGSTTVGDIAVFGGGSGGTAIYAYDSSLTMTIPTAMSVNHNAYPGAVTVGEYALFAAAIPATKVVDVYTVA